MMQKKSELTPADIKLVWYKDLWLKYLSMCEVDYYNDERMRLEYLCNLILDDLMRPEYRQVNLLELLYGYMTEETEEMRITEVEVPNLYKSLINDMINFEIIKRSYRYICTALDKDIVKGDVNDGQ